MGRKVMPEKVVIIIPSQGADTGAFEDTARKLSKEVYHSKATIVKTTVTPTASSFTVSFNTLDGKAFSWDDTQNLSRVLTISHAFSGDGPNLAYHSGGYQPWGSDGTGTALSEGGKSFWQTVGKALGKDGKVILLGCFMGRYDYAKLVAEATGTSAYASQDLFAAGNAPTAIKYVREIEHGKVPTPMKQFMPPSPTPSPTSAP
jgi:hypothetical protein